MAQHGYLGDDYGSGYNPGYDDDDRERGWRGDRDRSLMFENRGSRRDWERDDRDDDRGFFSRIGEEARSWFRDDDDEDDRGRFRGHGGSDAGEWFGGRSRSERGPDMQRGRGASGYGPEHGFGGSQGDYSGGGGQGGFGGRGDYERGRRSFSAHPDDHYLSWRQQQLEALDRDYQDYCREREQQFHQEFDSWRRNRQQSQPQGQGGGSGGQPAQARGGTGARDELLLDRKTGGTTTDAPQEPQSTVDTDSAATLGTTPETGSRGRR
jgi:hypothetical protein